MHVKRQAPRRVSIHSSPIASQTCLVAVSGHAGTVVGYSALRVNQGSRRSPQPVRRLRCVGHFRRMSGPISAVSLRNQSRSLARRVRRLSSFTTTSPFRHVSRLLPRGSCEAIVHKPTGIDGVSAGLAFCDGCVVMLAFCDGCVIMLARPMSATPASLTLAYLHMADPWDADVGSYAAAGLGVRRTTSWASVAADGLAAVGAH